MDAMAFDNITQLPFITPLNRGDNSLFYEVFHSDGICHANSWLYMLRATRDDQGNFGYKYWGRGVLIGIGYRKNTIYLTRPIGKKRHDVIVELCNQLLVTSKSRVVLRRLDQDLYTSLINTGQFSQLTNGEILEDDAYPETMVIPERLISSKPKLGFFAFKLRKKAKRFESDFKKLTVKTGLTEKDLNYILKAMLEMAKDVSEKYTSYSQMIKEILLNKDNLDSYKLFIYTDGKVVHGIYAIDVLEPDTAGLYCALTSKSYPGITEWMDYDFFVRMFELGVKKIYLGGSETQGVYQYINKLLPSPPPYKMFSLIYNRTQ